MAKGTLTWKIFWGIVANDLLDSLAHLWMKKGLAGTGITEIHLSNLLDFLSRGASSPLIWLGIGVYALNFFVWIVILSRMELSVAIPIGSTTYVLIPFLAMAFLHETITPLRWAGILLIVVGIHFISRSTRPGLEPA